MKILEMCDSEAATVPVEASAERAIQTMLDRHVGAVAVIDEKQRVAGIFTERDVLRRLSLSHHDPRKISVQEVMTTPVEMATRATTAAEALATMIERHYGICQLSMMTDGCWACFRFATCCRHR